MDSAPTLCSAAVGMMLSLRLHPPMAEEREVGEGTGRDWGRRERKGGGRQTDRQRQRDTDTDTDTDTQTDRLSLIHI